MKALNALLLGLLLPVSACEPKSSLGEDNPQNPMNPVSPMDPLPATGDEVKSNLPRLAPTAPTSAVDTLTRGTREFTFDLYQKARGDSDNFMFSSFSISQALAMTWAGARAATETEMARVLHFTQPQNELHAAMNTLDQALMSRGKNARGQDDHPFRLKVSNHVWGQKDYSFHSPYLDVLAEHYGAGLRIVDFITAAESARQRINMAVEQDTEGKIKNLLPMGSLNEETRLVLTNAVYFNAGWQFRFEKEATRDGTFHNMDGSTSTASMMRWWEATSVNYFSDDQVTAVELPYDGGEMSMLVVLPAAGKFSAAEDALTADRFDDIVKGLHQERVELTFPQFRFEFDMPLSEKLIDLGMGVAFSEGADFTGIADDSLAIKNVLHKTFISVNENGTEAAAATAVVAGTTSLPPPGIKVVVDRAFFYAIRDLQTKALLFVGRVGKI